MKKYLGVFIVLALTLAVNVQTSRAEDSDRVETEIKKLKPELKEKRDELKKGREVLKDEIKNIRKEAKQKMETLKEKIKEEKDAVKIKIKELRIMGREKALERFDKVAERLDELKNKISAQIAEFETKGIVTTNAKIFVATAETKLTAVGDKIAEINALLAVSINELSSENKTKLRTLTKDTQTLVRDAHQALKNAIKSLREAIKMKIELERSNNSSDDPSENSQ